MSGGLTIRAALPGDLPGLRRVAQETWLATYRDRIPEADIERFVEANYSLDILERMHARRGQAGHSGGLLVAVDGDEVVGYLSAEPNPEGDAEIYAIYVLPGEQGRGVGYRLWERAVEYFCEQGFDRFMLWVLAGNERAQAFYVRQGGRVTGERPFSIGGSEILELRYEFVIEDLA